MKIIKQKSINRYFVFLCFSLCLCLIKCNRGNDDQNSIQNLRINKTVIRISVDSEGIEGNDASFAPAVNYDGHIIAYHSNATNLADDDNNGSTDIFIYNRFTKETLRVGQGYDGNEINASSFYPSIDYTGQLLAFNSNATNLVIDDNNNNMDTFVINLDNIIVTRMSVNSNYIEAARGVQNFPVISGDSIFVAFESESNNLDATDINDHADIFVHHRINEEIERVSMTFMGSEIDYGSFNPAINEDGRYVAFDSRSANLIPMDTNAETDVFVYDRFLKTTERVSIGYNATEANGPSRNPSISSDGRYVTFESTASNLVINDSNFHSDIFIYDRVTQITSIVRMNSTDQLDGDSQMPKICANARYVVFESSATNLVANDNNSAKDIFIYDRISMKLKKVSMSYHNQEANANSYKAAISGNGYYIVYESLATNIVENDNNGSRDIFLSSNPFLH